MRPLFLLSLPRSGSTLVQRVLAAHPQISTKGEPFVLLPLLYGPRNRGARAEYWHEMSAEAHWDFIDSLPEREADWHAAVRAYADRLYTAAAEPGAEYFLDKTPRYALVAEELLDAFPDAAFVFLWRNPFSVLASCMETFRGGRFEPYHFAIDLFTATDRLVSAARRPGVDAFQIRYEDLVAGGESGWRALFAHLDLDWDPGVLERFADVELTGRYGDPTGRNAYRRISAEPAGKWHTLAGTRVRQAWLRHYLAWLEDGRLEVMGYDAAALRSELDAIPTEGAGVRDALDTGLSWVAHQRRRRALALPEGPRPRGPAFE